MMVMVCHTLKGCLALDECEAFGVDTGLQPALHSCVKTLTPNTIADALLLVFFFFLKQGFTHYVSVSTAQRATVKIYLKILLIQPD